MRKSAGLRRNAQTSAGFDRDLDDFARLVQNVITSVENMASFPSLLLVQHCDREVLQAREVFG